MPSSSAAAANVSRPVAEREPDEVALRLGHVASRRPAARPPTRARSATSASTRSSSAGSASREAIAAAWATARDAEGERDRAERRGERLLRDGVPDPEPGQPVGLGEGAEHHHVGVRAVGRDARRPCRPSARTRRRPRRRRRAGPRAPRARNASSSDCVTAGPVGLLGVHTITHRVRGVIAASHRVEVVAAVRGHRHRHRRRGRGGDRDRVGLEGAPRVDDLVAGLAEGVEQLVDQRHRAGGRSKVADRDAEPARRGRRTARCCPCPGSGSSRRPPGARPRRRRAAAGRGSRWRRACTTSSPAGPAGGLPAT